MALVGDSRVAEILANVAFPFLAAQGAEVWESFAKLPSRLSNRRLETAVTRLFGENARGRSYGTPAPSRRTRDMKSRQLLGVSSRPRYIRLPITSD